MCVRVLRSTKIGHFYTKTLFLTFSEIFNFGWFWQVFPTLGSILGAQTCSNQLRHGASNGQGHPKEFFGPWHGGGLEHPGGSYRVKRGIFRNLNFQLNFLPAPESPIEILGIIWYTHLDLRLGLGIFELSPRRKMLGQRRPKSGVGYILPEPQDSSKNQKTGHFGAKNLPKTNSKHICAVWDE